VKPHEKKDPHHQATTAMAAPKVETITPYSIAVAPLSSLIKFLNIFLS
jgi:hypothetical protein